MVLDTTTCFQTGQCEDLGTTTCFQIGPCGDLETNGSFQIGPREDPETTSFLLPFPSPSDSGGDSVVGDGSISAVSSVIRVAL